MNEFSYKLKVFYEDTDTGGVVYYANYLKFFERARTEAIAEIGLSNKKKIIRGKWNFYNSEIL